MSGTSEGAFPDRVNRDMVELEQLDETPEEAEEVRLMIERHHRFTGSTVAAGLLDAWDDRLAEFVRIIPIDYKWVLKQQKEKAMEAVHG